MRTRLIQSSSDPAGSHTHRSVLLEESIEVLNIQPDDIVVDATLGLGGHASEIARRLGARGILIGFDADEYALRAAREKLSGVRPVLYLERANFRTVGAVLDRIGVPRITKALFDLGWNTTQLDAGRGFSFQTDEPLLMTYETSPDPSALTADSIVNTWSEESLANVFFGYGEERYARRIARAICRARETRRIETARELADIIRSAVPSAYARGRIHPATKSFQGLRIAVNDELGALKEGISAAWERLAPGGRIAVITFHSIEDREVKRMFRAFEEEGGRRLSKKPVVPSAEEIAANPRSRSAKLRSIEKHL